MDEETQRGLRRENESALLLARLGYDIEQNPVVQGRKKPDYQLEGEIFDHMAPSTDKVRSIHTTARDKVKNEQAHRLVIFLDDTPVRINDLRDQFTRWKIEGLHEVLLIRRGEVRRLLP